MVERWLPDLPGNLWLGTSSFSWADWNGCFYPDQLPESERLGYYARHFPTVEIDSSFYGIPSRSTVSRWALKTPESFVFALKMPKELTHDTELAEPDAATAKFLDHTSLLGPRRGPLLLQFPYVAKGKDADEYEHGYRFTERLADWLERWGGHAPWVVEVRNATWLRPRLLELLRAHQVPLALTAYYTMPTLRRLQHLESDPLTGPFAYLRFIGDHRRMDALLAECEEPADRRFNRLVWDREDELRGWVDALLPVITRMRVYAYFNNHYGGFGPGSARLFADLWRQINDLA
ncbi:MAG: DUF72 domain-containing protein [Armatimonadetes bacterium]|nr:DUF72 domain-containing protein [Armatimonadota bacterium]